MKLEQRFNPAAWAYTCVLTAAIGGNPAFAVEKTAYDGAWSTPDPNISLKITPQAASFTIDGKTYTDTTPEYFNALRQQVRVKAGEPIGSRSCQLPSETSVCGFL